MSGLVCIIWFGKTAHRAVVEARAVAMLAAALRETLRIIIVIKKSSRMGGVRCEGSGVEVDESSWR